MSAVRTIDAELVLDARAAFGEGPAWDTGQERLLWVDIPAGRVHAFDPQTGADSWVAVGQDVSAAVPHAAGGVALAVRDGFAHLTPDGEVRMLADLSQSGMRMNDGKCAPDGAFWAGSMAYDRTPGAAALYRLDLEGCVQVQLEGLTISNGPAFARDGTFLYHADTPTRRIDRYEAEPGTQRLTGRRTLLELQPGVGNPDGMTLDDEECLWVALPRGRGAVHRYRPDGALDTVVHVGVTMVTSCCFGGSDGTDLFITTAPAPAGSPVADEPHAGGLFRVAAGVSGPAATPYAGPGS